MSDDRVCIRCGAYAEDCACPLGAPVLPAEEIRSLRAELAATLARAEKAERERDAAIDALAEKGLSPLARRAADALADEVAVLVRRKVVDSRSPAADALLDYRDPPSTERADRIAAAESALAAAREMDAAENQLTECDEMNGEVCVLHATVRATESREAEMRKALKEAWGYLRDCHQGATLGPWPKLTGYHGDCLACGIEADIGNEENPHPVPREFHTCGWPMGPAREGRGAGG